MLLFWTSLVVARHGPAVPVPSVRGAPAARRGRRLDVAIHARVAPRHPRARRVVVRGARCRRRVAGGQRPVRVHVHHRLARPGIPHARGTLAHPSRLPRHPRRCGGAGPGRGRRPVGGHRCVRPRRWFVAGAGRQAAARDARPRRLGGRRARRAACQPRHRRDRVARRVRARSTDRATRVRAGSPRGAGTVDADGRRLPRRLHRTARARARGRRAHDGVVGDRDPVRGALPHRRRDDRRDRPRPDRRRGLRGRPGGRRRAHRGRRAPAPHPTAPARRARAGLRRRDAHGPARVPRPASQLRGLPVRPLPAVLVADRDARGGRDRRGRSGTAPAARPAAPLGPRTPPRDRCRGRCGRGSRGTVPGQPAVVDGQPPRAGEHRLLRARRDPAAERRDGHRPHAQLRRVLPVVARLVLRLADGRPRGRSVWRSCCTGRWRGATLGSRCCSGSSSPRRCSTCGS